MIRTLLATTALATLIASGAYAQDATAPANPPAPAATTATPAVPTMRADGSLATNIIGETVYNGTGDDAENIGKVDDIVFDKDGNAKSLIIGVGGFLGLGAKDVAFDYGKVEWAEKNGDRWLVAKTTKEELTAQADFDRKPFEPAPAPAATDATAPSTGTGTAQNTPAPAPAAPVEPAEGSLATNILGESVYNGSGDDAQNIGDVNDIVVNTQGKAESLIIGVGGFLGVGEKNVAYDFSKAKWAEKNGDRWLVANATKEDLEALPDFDRKAYDPAAAPVAANDTTAPAPMTATPPADTAQNAPAATTPAPADQTAEAPAATTPAPADQTAEAPAATTPAPADKTAEAPAASTPAPADKTAEAPAATAPAPADQTAEAPATPDATATDKTATAAIDKSTLTEMPAGDMRAEDLVGTTVYGANDANVGEIGDVVLSQDKKVDAIIIDVGGFLGIGEKEVAVGMDNLKFMTDKDGNKYLYTTFTKEQLEAQAAYDKGSYAQKRDEQRMIMTQ